MEWYYAVENERKGPFGDADFQGLVQQGVITRETLIWREGMSAWGRYGDTVTSSPSGSTAEPRVVCVACGRSVPRSESILLDDKPCCAACKPQVLAQIKAGLPIASPAAEEFRNRYLKHEASIKSVGTLYYLGGAIILLTGIAGFISAINTGNGIEGIIVSGILSLLGALQFWAAYGIRRLRSWTKVPVGILSGIGVLGFPLGTVINGYILYLFFSEKGKVVFSPEYQLAIAQTPHIKYRTSIVVWIILGLVILLIALGLGAAFVNRS